MTTTRDERALHEALTRCVAADRVLTRPIERTAFASDASVYRLTPRAVVLACGVEDVRRVMALCRQSRIPMTFRAAGTSLSGQAVTDGILVEVKRHWRAVEVLDGGRRVRVAPGVLGGEVNAALRPFGAKIGPDPASLNACAIGGILANNSSGKCCGVAQNAYHTLDALTFVLPSGTVVNTADADADDRFRAAEPALAGGLLDLKRTVEADAALASRIRAKYRMKNTTGYGLNALVDYQRPVDIFSHLLIGSEGTLAFIADAVLRTVPDLPCKYTGLLFFDSVHDACAAIAPLRSIGAKALELMDRAALRAVEHQRGVPPVIATLPPNAAGLLVEFQAASPDALTSYREAATRLVQDLRACAPPEFTGDPLRIAALWRVRDGMYPSVGAVRASGTSVIIEDIAFPLEHLPDAVLDLERLFARHGYTEAIVFGHAGDGNLHFVITQSFNDAAAIDRYARFMDDLVHLVVRTYDGALKAEHGTGRNMAPFVEAEWGPDAVAVMRRLKALADPDGILNPGVILAADPRAHLQHLKTLPSVEDVVDTCVECGFCERVCPSRDLTLTPRQRIAVRREIARSESVPGGADAADALWADYTYMGLDTCAADGMCGLACPVGINTGVLVKRFRQARHSRTARRAGRVAARRFAWMERLARTGVRAGHALRAVIGDEGVSAMTRLARRAAGPSVPTWMREVPAPAPPLPATTREGAAAVYVPSCITRVLGAIPGERSAASLPRAFTAVAGRAGFPLWIPPDVAGTCCGMPFASKGLVEGHRIAANRFVERSWAWTREGRLPLVIDVNSCTLGLREAADVLTAENRERHRRLRVIDAVECAARELLPRLAITRRVDSVAVHPTCSLQHLGLLPDLTRLADACAETVVLPAAAGCCGFAGDRGFLFPELPGSATRDEAAALGSAACSDYVSSNRMCEIAMTRATGRVYRSIVHLLDEATRA